MGVQGCSSNLIIYTPRRISEDVICLQSPYFINSWVYANFVKQTIQYDELVRDIPPHCYMTTDKSEELYILHQVVN
jgi:hypothetical protein